MQNSLFDLENRYASLSKTGDPLERLNATIDWEIFRPILERLDAKVRKSNAGRKPTCRILMFKMLVLQRLNGLSDERLQYQFTDRLSFMRFLGVALAGNVPDARTVWAFREALREHELTDALFDRLNQALAELGIELKSGQIIDAIPQQVRVIRHERVKYACPCCDGALRLVPKPAQIIPKGLFSESALAWITTSKFDDGLPLYRQSALLARLTGADFSKNTMATSIVRVGIGVQPVINLMRDHLLESPITFGDETTVQVLKEAGRSPQSRSYMWVQMSNASGSSGTGPPIRLFSYAPSRSGATAQALYAGMSRGSVLMSDGYEVYSQVALTHDLVHLGCWAHCRRYVVEALDSLPKIARTPDKPASQFLALIARLYAVESHAQDNNLSASERLRYRQQHSVAVLGHIQTLLLVHLHAVVPGSALGKALHYMSAQWPKLSRYVEDGSYPIDNNPAENSIRPFVVGRKNWLFSDTVAGANASANLYSLLQTCKVNGINSYRYLQALLVALPLAQTADDYEALLPWNIVLPPG